MAKLSEWRFGRRDMAKYLAALPFVLPPQLGAAQQKANGYLRTNWSKDPWAYGSYSYVPRGARQRDRNILREAIDGRVYFAGEAVHPHYNSTVHAAYESGVMAADAVRESNARRVAVIGAGMSGLAAAHALSFHGYEVTVFESRDRIGGRVWTSSAMGLPLDMGASWIHGVRGNPITELADAVNAKRIVTDHSSTVSRGANGERIADRDLPRWLSDVEAQISAGAERENINIWAYLLQDDYGGDEVVFPGGYAELFGALSGDYGVYLNYEIHEVDYRDRDVILRWDGGDAAFDAVVVTLPLGVLKRSSVRFEPALSEDKSAALEKLGMGLLDKLYLRFNHVFWDQEAVWLTTPETGLPRGQFNAWLNLHALFGAPILVAFNGGQAAHDLAELSDEPLLVLALSVLDKAYPSA